MSINFVKDLLFLHMICLTKKYSLFPNILSQLRYNTLSWILDHPIIKNQTGIQKTLITLLWDEYNKETYVPKLQIVSCDPKPVKINKLVDISKENPYKFFLSNDKLNLEVNTINRLGQPGKEGTVYLVNMLFYTFRDPIIRDFSKKIYNTYAMKVYKKNKSFAKVLKEAQFQQIAARCGVAPKIYAIFESNDPCISLDVSGPAFIMDLAGERVIDRIKKQNGLLTSKQQFNLLLSALKLDSCGVRQNDPNPLNFMFASKTSDEVIWIDFGFAVKQESNEINNFMSLHTFLHSGMMGVISRKILKPEGAKILEFWLVKAKEQGKKLTEKDITLLTQNKYNI
jgi:predicted Ser/Thr protein kinase